MPAIASDCRPCPTPIPPARPGTEGGRPRPRLWISVGKDSGKAYILVIRDPRTLHSAERRRNAIHGRKRPAYEALIQFHLHVRDLPGEVPLPVRAAAAHGALPRSLLRRLAAPGPAPFPRPAGPRCSL